MKILLDTDIGSDIDDAVCLAYLLAQPACELLGITTVTGQSEKRAALASVLCKAAGKDVPIFPGAEEPLMRSEAFQPVAPQAEALPRWPHQAIFPKGQAVEFLRQTIRENPGEIVLLTIGPLTNIGLLFKTDPEIARLLKGFVMMGGVFTNRLAGVGPLEWNAMGDPHATAIVYNTPVRQHRSIGLDVTCQVNMPAEEVNRRFVHPLLQPVKDFAQVWFQHMGWITFHDPLAAVTIFNPDICGFERGQVEVELASQRLAGLTYWKVDANGSHEAAFQVDPDRFFQHYFSMFQ
jgi:inosine-uridine nucleoside N-ribohydrolase